MSETPTIAVKADNPSDKLHSDARLKLNETNRDIALREGRLRKLEEDYRHAQAEEQAGLDDDQRIKRAWEAMLGVFEGNGPEHVELNMSEKGE